jgi:ketosteroid isomerase-like protein
MRKLMITVAVAVLMTGPLFAAEKSEKADVMDVVNQLMDAFNKGDQKTVLALCTDEMSIIDEFPPHEWHGAGACQKWLDDYDADAKKNGITDGVVGIGKPRHVDVTGDRAYVVVPASYTWKQNGKPEKETDATWTLTLQKGKDGWRITGWSWAKP